LSRRSSSAYHLTIDVLWATFFSLKKSAAPGVDEMTGTEYVEGLEENLSVLYSRVQTGAYRALPAGNIFRRRMADSGRSASLRWKMIPSSKLRLGETCLAYIVLGAGAYLGEDS
jgi:hypothetical protein